MEIVAIDESVWRRLPSGIEDPSAASQSIAFTTDPSNERCPSHQGVRKVSGVRPNVDSIEVCRRRRSARWKSRSFMSKSVAAGIRGGWISCPPGYTARIHAAHKLLTGGMPFLLAELAARLVLDGEAARIRQAVREEIAAREAIARQTLAGFDFTSHPHCPFMWITVPEPWQSGTLKKAAENDGILIDDEDEFKSGRTERAYHRIRVGFTVPGERDAVARGFSTLCELMRGGNAVYDSYS